MVDKNREKAERAVTVYAALSVGLVCILVGLPLWWKTTTVYRVSLPYSEIDRLNTLKLVSRVEVNLVVFDDDIISNLPVFTSKIQQLLEGREVLDPRLAVEYATSVRKASETERNVFLHRSKSAGIQVPELSAQLLGNTQYTYCVAVLPQTSGDSSRNVVISGDRISYIYAEKDLDTLSRSISSVVRHVFSGEQAVLKALQHATGATHSQSNKAGMRSVRTHAAYDLTFTFLNPQPEMIDAKWDMEGAEKVFIDPLVEQLKDYATIEVKSQVLYKMGLGVRPKREQSGDYSTLSEADLPHIINPVEAYLGSHVSNNPNLNFLVYLPTRDQAPLHILHSNGEKSTCNAFLSPRWGSFLVYNTELAENVSLPYPHHVDMDRVMGVLLPHIKLLLGIPAQNALADAEFLPARDHRILSDWEVLSWLRSGCVENTMSAVVTLTSLADLLQKINNIVINDDIGNAVEKAVHFIEKSERELAAGNLTSAFRSSQQAVFNSEKAFFDPSLLELLYFPEDQKFAIYIPLFLPVGIPILMSLIQALRYFTKKEDKSKTE